MLNYLLPIISVLLGFLVVLVLKPSEIRHLKLLLAFSGAFLLSITVFSFLPEVYNQEGANVGIFIMIGIFQNYISVGFIY